MAKISPQDIWVVIPGYNEAKYLQSVLTKTLKITPNIIFVDDGSVDLTSKIAHRHLSHVVTHLTNLGKGAALKTGCEYAFNKLSAKAVVFMDSDDQHNPQDLKLFFKELKEHDVIFGERSLDHHMPLIRIIGNRLASVMILFLFGSYIPDIPSGFKGLTKAAYDQISWTSQDYAVEMEIAARVAKGKIPYQTVSVETIYHDMDRGMNILDIIRTTAQLLTWRFML